MTAIRKEHRPAAKPRPTRTSATIPPEVYDTLQEIAKRRKVSLAWVIRDAAEKYIAEQWPLLERANHS